MKKVHRVEEMNCVGDRGAEAELDNLGATKMERGTENV